MAKRVIIKRRFTKYGKAKRPIGKLAKGLYQKNGQTLFKKAAPKIDWNTKNKNVRVRQAAVRAALNGGGGLGEGKHYHVIPAKPNLTTNVAVKEGMHICYSDNLVNSLTSLIGYQSIGEVGSLCLPYNSLAKGIELLGNQNIAQHGGFFDKNVNMVLKDVSMQIELKNVCENNINMKMYECVPRYDSLSTSYATTFTNANLLPLGSQVWQNYSQLPSQNWVQGMIDTVQYTSGNFTTVGGTSASFIVNNTPFQSKKFCENFKISHVHQIDLNPGGNYRYEVDMHVNRKLNGARIDGLSTGHMGKLSRYYMLVLNGSIASDSGSPGYVTNSGARVDFSTNYKYNFYAFSESSNRSLMIDNTAKSWINHAEIINPFTDAPIVVDDVDGDAE